MPCSGQDSELDPYLTSLLLYSLGHVMGNQAFTVSRCSRLGLQIRGLIMMNISYVESSFIHCISTRTWHMSVYYCHYSNISER